MHALITHSCSLSTLASMQRAHQFVHTRRRCRAGKGSGLSGYRRPAAARCLGCGTRRSARLGTPAPAPSCLRRSLPQRSRIQRPDPQSRPTRESGLWSPSPETSAVECATRAGRSRSAGLAGGSGSGGLSSVAVRAGLHVGTAFEGSLVTETLQTALAGCQHCNIKKIAHEVHCVSVCMQGSGVRPVYPTRDRTLHSFAARQSISALGRSSAIHRTEAAPFIYRDT